MCKQAGQNVFEETKKIEESKRKEYETELAHWMQKYNVPDTALDELRVLNKKLRG